MLEKIGEVLADIWETFVDFISDNSDIIMGGIVALIIVGLLVGLLASEVVNERNAITEGLIVDKQMYAGGTHYSSDKNGGRMHTYQTAFYFTISGEKNGEPVEYTFEVTEADYSAYKIGDWYER